ncbi:hypothetical protein AB0H97_28365 [Streptomyces sp. NPDC050788]|uniref:hypothetical protein n=1 Tax=Streptomyces sp. NPDC050788 TaxID=3155041 RepID=UPI0034258BBD
MDAADGHIHVDAKMLTDNPAVRGMLAATFGLVGDPPSVVTTGCGLQAPYAMTSRCPESAAPRRGGSGPADPVPDCRTPVTAPLPTESNTSYRKRAAMTRT